jgi:hypothetical protein
VDAQSAYQRQVARENARLLPQEGRWRTRRRLVVIGRLVLVAWAVAVVITHVA